MVAVEFAAHSAGVISWGVRCTEEKEHVDLDHFPRPSQCNLADPHHSECVRLDPVGYLPPIVDCPISAAPARLII